MKYIKDNWKFLLIVFILGSIGSIFTVFYTIKQLDSETIDLVIKQVGSLNLFIVISSIETILFYVIICGILGLILSNKVGLWKKITFEKEKIYKSIIIAILGGILLVAGDRYIFGHFNEIIYHLYDSKPTIEYTIMSFLYGGVVEELMLRLFFMSLIAFVIYKLFYRKEKEVPIKEYIIANIIAAIAFALGHLPQSIQLFGEIDALILIRCILMNGGFGLAFGWLYRKYGINYSMLAHFGCHLVSQIIWILFI